MGIEGFFSDDPNWVLSETSVFLSSEPVHHHLVLTLLQSRTTHYEPGRYWVAQDNKTTVGVVVQSPLNSRALITPMTSEVVPALVNAISEANVALPGVAGDATTAHFAGEWAERNKSPVFPFLGLRLYEVNEIQNFSDVKGRFRKAVLDDRKLLIDWVSRFSVDIGEKENTSDDEELQKREAASSRIVDSYLSAGDLWLWEDTEPVSMVARTTAVADVVQVRLVYTPQDHRNRGYATACVGKMSKQILEEGNRCILYTDLNNPISNTIYRRIGYRAVAEAIQYRFE
ncbi:MAG: GNAT family N-acetyltransferase [Candidatus Poribacteria bacterium]|nr:GNAT family N-acetyltransferase [Candidatus Poribacteria bacterium]